MPKPPTPSARSASFDDVIAIIDQDSIGLYTVTLDVLGKSVKPEVLPQRYCSLAAAKCAAKKRGAKWIVK